MDLGRVKDGVVSGIPDSPGNHRPLLKLFPWCSWIFPLIWAQTFLAKGQAHRIWVTVSRCWPQNHMIFKLYIYSKNLMYLIYNDNDKKKKKDYNFTCWEWAPIWRTWWLFVQSANELESSKPKPFWACSSVGLVKLEKDVAHINPAQIQVKLSPFF